MHVPKWLIALFALFELYSAIARYCDFKEAVGWDVRNCSHQCR